MGLRCPALPDDPRNRQDLPQEPSAPSEECGGRHHSSTSLRALWEVLVRRRRVVLGIEGGLLLACLLYCLIAPNEYEARARVALRTAPASSLSLDAGNAQTPASFLAEPVVVETLAGVLRSEELAWRTISALKLYQEPGFETGFLGSFARRFPGFRADAPSADAQAWLIERFERRLAVETIPRTLLVQIRFRSRDAALSAAVVNALMLETIHPSSHTSAMRVSAALLMLVAAGVCARGQAPTPSTSGLPTGVASFPQTPETRSQPNPKEAPPVWNQPGAAPTASTLRQTVGQPQGAGQPAMPAPIGPGDWLDISEYHTPAFHSSVRVSTAGAVTLPLVGDVNLKGMDEQAAAHAIETALAAQGMLLHPLVSVVVTFYAGEDVSVLGEVARPGVYPYGVHHRLLDVISQASGLAPDAGRLVNVFHRDDPQTPHPVLLDPGGSDATADHNPELAAGDTVQVSRAGLVYVVGDLIRPGGFPLDPAQKLTVVQAIALAWGPTQNAALGKAVLVREQKDGRTLTALNLKRLLRGEDPDQPVHDGDIIFVPDSFAKNLMNRTLESAVQSTIGVSIYSALVYSQRY